MMDELGEGDENPFRTIATDAVIDLDANLNISAFLSTYISLFIYLYIYIHMYITGGAI